MNRFWIALTVLFSMNLTIAASVSANNYFFRNGIESYKNGIKYYENRRRDEGDNSFEDSIEFLEEALKRGLAPSQENQARLRLGISRYYLDEVERAIESLDLALRQGRLNHRQQAEAYFYRGMSSLAIGENPAAQRQFKEALKFNSSLKFPSSLNHEEEAKDLFEAAREDVKGRLTISLSPPEVENWTIWINGKKLDRIDRDAVVSRNGLRLFEGTHTIKGTYKKEKSLEQTVEIRSGDSEEVSLKIPLPTVEHELHPSVDAGKEIELTFRASRKKPNQVNIYYRKASEWEFTPKGPDNPPRHSSEGWTYTVNLPPQNSVGKIEYYIQATYEDPSTEIRNPENRYDYHQISIIDKTPPKISLLKPDDDAKFTANQSITIEAKVTDNISVKEVVVHFLLPFESRKYGSFELFEEGSSGIYTTIERFPPGTYWYHVTATDGRREGKSEKRWLKIITDGPPSDNLHPTITLLKPLDGATFTVNQRITITAEVTDNISVKEVVVHFLLPFESRKYGSFELFEEGSSGIYTTIERFPPGTYWYHVTATDGRREGKSEKRWLKIITDGPPSDNLHPTITLLKPLDGATFTVNQRITITAEVTDNISVKDVRVLFSKKVRVLSELSEKAPGIYTIDIAAPEVGDISYHFTATDQAENSSESKKRRIEIKPESEQTLPPPPPPPIRHQGIRANFALSNDFFKDGPSAFDWGRGSLLGIAYLYEGKNCLTFGGQLDFPDWTNKLSNPILTGQLGYSWEKFGLAGLGRGRISDNSTYSLGGSLKLYPWDRVTIDFTGSINLQSVSDARTNGASISDLLDTTHLDHYEIGIRFYYWRPVILRVGFGGWHLGRNTTGVQIGFGYTW